MVESTRPPVAIVALGDLSRGDQGLPARVMGRARTLIGEIGRLRERPHSLSLSESGAEEPQFEGSLALASRPIAGPIVDWIESAGPNSRLDRVLAERRRVVLIDTVELGEKAGHVYHWHLENASPGGLSALSHYHKGAPLGFQHLAFWLEDDLPPNGLDFVGIEPHDCAARNGISMPIRRRLGTISSQVAAILLRILAEEGW